MIRKTTFFEWWSWFKFNNLGLAPGSNLKFYNSLSKGLKLKVRKFWGLIPTFVEVTGEKTGRGGRLFSSPHASSPSCKTRIYYLYLDLETERFGECSVYDVIVQIRLELWEVFLNSKKSSNFGCLAHLQ